ncbi:aminotransferase class V-fold PLP-dependent enzyme [Alienimonas californiensis]|uniref:Cysteine desulfurase n=1 Tax=Alienimonas californiensis TaxID=2527989 RepID=A0A517PCJ2_9PLAN|nr:SufS family cysteine desulfurase [Alienimonas californiensis]QDT17090.1 putative cysteine desulfurase [Alienimonas californiensis]
MNQTSPAPEARVSQVIDAPPPNTPLDVDAVRAQFPILNRPLPNGKALTYLDSGATAQKPAVVLDAMRECFENYYSNVHRGKSTLGRQVTGAVEQAREDCRRFVGAADASEIVFTAGTTAGINLVADTWARANLQRGDVIATTLLEHHANLVPWQMVAAQTGAELRFLPLTDDGRIDMSRLDEALTDRTKLLAVTACSNVLGTLPDVKALCDAARAVGAVSVIDAAQFVPHRRTDVRAWGCDFLTFSGHKLYGPTGVGVLYGRRDLLEAMPPWQGGGNMIHRVFADRSEWAPPPAKFEAGTPPIAEVIGLGAAVNWVESLDWEAIEQHDAELAAYALERLQEVPGLTVYGPSAEHRAALASFTVEGAAAEDLNFLLDRRGIAVRHGHHCTMPLHDLLGVPATTRASFGVYNTPAEVDVLIEALLAARIRLRLG